MVLLTLGLGGLAPPPERRAVFSMLPADTALIVSVDVSSSVDDRRYALQMDGIAAALEDEAVIDTLLGGERGATLFTMITWSSRQRIDVPWIRVGTPAEARDLAARLRAMPRRTGDFTCISEMLRFLSDKVVPGIPASVARIVIDVSGDGSDNCNPVEPASAVRDALAAKAVTINGLPILEDREAATLEAWYRDNVIGGPGAFVLAARGYVDVGRAMRQKFLVEVSGAPIVRAPKQAAGGMRDRYRMLFHR